MLFSVLMGLFGSGCSNELERGMRTANALMYEQNYVDAERLYRKLLRRMDGQKELDSRDHSDRLQILHRLGEINSLYLRDYGQAISDYENLVRHDPKAPEARQALATVGDISQFKLGNYALAIDAYQRLTHFFPDSDEARHAQLQSINACVKLRSYAQAQSTAEALQKRWPNTLEAAQAQFEIANIHMVQKQYTEAIAAYEKLLGHGQDSRLSALVLFELGNCYQELGEGERALIFFYACLANHPNPELVQRKISRVRARLHHTAPASILNAQVSSGRKIRPRGEEVPVEQKTPESGTQNTPVGGETVPEGVRE